MSQALTLLTFIRGGRGGSRYEYPIILTEIFRDLPQYLQANPEIGPHDRFHQHLSPFHHSINITQSDAT
jgi:hypothetical protein